MRKILLLLNICVFLGIQLSAQNSMTKIYSAGDIPTSKSEFDENCNGPGTTLQFTLPPGENITVTGFDVTYTMVAVDGNTLEQRSAISFQNTGSMESEITGPFQTGGSHTYVRNNVAIANGTYAGGTILVLEMNAYRRLGGGDDCNFLYHIVENNSWEITLYYSDAFTTPRVGMLTTTPQASFEVKGKMKISDDNIAAIAGNIRYNQSEKDFEGYDGFEWRSFTLGDNGIGVENYIINENQMDLIPNPVPSSPAFGVREDQILSEGNSLIVSNLQSVHLYQLIDKCWTLKDNLVVNSPTLESFEGEKLIIRRNNGSNMNFKTYSTNGGVFKLLEEEDINVGGDLNQSTVSFKNETVIIGKPNDGATGEVKIFNRANSPWSLEQTLVPPTTAVSQDQFGTSALIHKEKLYIGSTQQGLVGTDVLGAGVVYVYEINGTTWQLTETIVSPDIIDNWKFGNKIVAFDNELLINARPATTTTNGKIYNYCIKSSSHILTEEVTSPSPFKGFAENFIVEDDYLMVSNRKFSNSTIKAFVYKKNQHWELINELTIPRLTTGANVIYSTGMGMNNNSLFFGIVEGANSTLHGIYVLDRENPDPISYSDITDIPTGMINLWQEGGDNIYFDNNVGIGMDNPQNALDVTGNITVIANSTSANAQLNLIEDNEGFSRLNFSNSSNQLITLAADSDMNVNNSKLNFYIEDAGNVMVIKGNDRVGVNVDNPETSLHVNFGSGTDKGFRLENTLSNWWRMYVSSQDSDLKLYNASNGNSRGTFDYTTGAYSSASDRRLKKNIADLHFDWESFMKLKPSNYIFKEDKSQEIKLGLIAQDAQLIYPELVSYSAEEDTYKLDYSGTGVVAIKAVQELYKANQDLKDSNHALKVQNEIMMSQLENLEGKIEQILSTLEQ